MAAKNLLDDLERKIEERYLREKAAIQLLRKAGSIDHSAIDEIPADLVPREPESNEATIEAACERIVNRCKSGGYLRLSEVIQQLEMDGVGLPTDGRQLRRKIRLLLQRLAQQRRIRTKTGRGRAGTTYLPKRTEDKGTA